MTEQCKRAYRIEAPLFTTLDRTSFSFAFEIAYRRPPRPGWIETLSPRDPEGDRVAFRLRALLDRLLADRKRRADLSLPDPAFSLLVEPVRSFLDDVTTGPPGTNGRPFLFLASGAESDADSRRAWFHRGESWEYEYEGCTTVLEVPADRRVAELRIRDSFCAFDSGRLFYILTFTQSEAEDATARGTLDEYGVLQLQQLALRPKQDATDLRCAGFSDGAIDPVPLVAFAEHRLRAIESDVSDVPNGIRDIIVPYGLAGHKLERQPVKAEGLHRLCIGIESDDMFAVASCAIEMYEGGKRDAAYLDAARQAPAAGGADEAPEETPAQAVLRLDAAWRDSCRDPGETCEYHVSADGEDFERPLLAIAGMVQGVPDFPAQDDSEIHDSTRPTAKSVESALFTHPRLMIEIAKSWRSYQRGRGELGTCPYLLLTFLVAVHDELVVRELEERIETMIYAAPRRITPGRWLRAGAAGLWRRVRALLGQAPAPFSAARASPMADVRDVLDHADSMFLSNVGILESNIRRRLELFRWASIHRSGNIFRYPKETAALAAVRAASGTEARFNEAHDMVDRIESLVEDVSGLRSSYAERRTNTILFALAILGIVQLPVNLAQSVREWPFLNALYRRHVIDGLGIPGPLPAPSPDQESRPSKSS